MMIKNVYVDIDGVLADLQKYVQDRTGLLPADFVNAAGKSEYGKFIARHIKSNQMFYNLPQKRDLKTGRDFLWKLYCLGFNVRYLTACSATSFFTVSGQKKCWLQKNGMMLKNQDGTNWKTLFVQHGLDKVAYSNSVSLLIDDRQDICEAWEKQGGIAIHHKDFKTTEYEFGEILKTFSEK